MWSSFLFYLFNCFVFPDSTEATVMCFDQRHSGSAGKPAERRRPPAGLRQCLLCTLVYMRVCPMANEGRTPLSPPRPSRRLLVIILWEAGPDVGNATCNTQTHTVQTLSGILQSFVCTLRCERACTPTHTHTHIQDCLRKLEYCDKVLYFL